jgi:hypothetical protein
LLTEEILAEPLTYANFELTVPDGPGLGVELDEDKIAFCGVIARCTLVHVHCRLKGSADSMLFMVEMDVNMPPDFDADGRRD